MALKNAKDVPALKAVSQNLMHSNLSITDGIYGILSNNDLQEQITSLCKRNIESENFDIEKLVFLTEKLLEKIEKG